MIEIYDIGNEDFSSHGNAVLSPISCKHTQAAAGKYDLTLVHPLDPGGKWQHIVEEAIIKAPVQPETISTAYSGLAADLYVTTAAAALRSGASEPSAITYTAWSAGTSYTVGTKVTYSSHNYQLEETLTGQETYSTPDTLSKWARIADTSPGSPVLVNLKSGTSLYYVEASSTTGWSKVCTMYGLEGFIKDSQIEFVKHLTPEETKPRTITTQLFRIRSVNIDTKGRTVTATAEHVSYDMSGVLVEGVKIAQKNPATALAWIETGCMMDYRGTIASDMTSDDDGTYTGEINGKNLVYCLLDPDKGIVATFDAAYKRDNWDVFVMRKTTVDRGFRLRYGKNMLGVTWNRKSDGLITRVVPVAKAADGSDLFLDNSGVRWVDSANINDYPVIRMEWLKVPGQVGKDDGTETATKWTETTLRAEMQTKAEERFSIDKVDQVIHEVTVDFEQLGDTAEYKTLKGLETALMYDQVAVIDERIGLSVSAEVVEIEYDCIREKVTALKVANVNAYGGRNVSGFNVVNNSITGDKLTDGAVSGIVGTIQEDAVSESKTYTNSEISTLQAWVTANFVPIS